MAGCTGHAHFSIFVPKQMSRSLELRFPHVAMALQTGLNFRPHFQKFCLSLRVGKKLARICRCLCMMRAVTAHTGKTSALVFASAPHGMLVHLRVAPLTGGAGLCRFHLCGVLDFGWIAFSDMSLAWTVTSFATGHLVFPVPSGGQFRMDGEREVLELCFVTVFACFTAHKLRRLSS